ncbi:MAG: hypothetical protein J0L66_17575 [Cytophagales bacterium]|nr:hypothetical protein [Cytophagales bacterium]
MKAKQLLFLSTYFLIVGCEDSNQISTEKDDLARYKEEINFKKFYNSKLSKLGTINLDQTVMNVSNQGDKYYVSPILGNGIITGAVYSARKFDGSFVSFYVSSVESLNSNGWYHFYDNQLVWTNSIKIENNLIVESKDLAILGRVNSCTGNCYSTVMNACDADPDCRLMCDGLNIFFGICSIEVMVACAIHCAIQ